MSVCPTCHGRVNEYWSDCGPGLIYMTPLDTQILQSRREAQLAFNQARHAGERGLAERLTRIIGELDACRESLIETAPDSDREPR